MDVLKLKSSFMRKMVAGLVSKAISKKLGCDIDVLIEEIEVENKDGKTHIHVNLHGETDTENIAKIVKSIGMD